MSGILVVAFLIQCSQSLLLCEEIDTLNLSFRDMGACREQLSEILATEQGEVAGDLVVMGRCRYLLVESARSRAIAKVLQPSRMHSNGRALASRSGVNQPD